MKRKLEPDTAPPEPAPQAQPPQPAPELSETQMRAMELVFQGHNVFVTGGAGTGKSFLLQELVGRLREAGKRVIVAASTGVAAFNVRGVTLHHFGGVGLGEMEVGAMFHTVRKNAVKKARWVETDVLVIDEISMLHAEYLIKLSALGKKIRSCSAPFGGMQVVMVGDYMQLLAITKKDEKLVLPFNTPLWREMRVQNCVLRENFRQQEDADFGALLGRVRVGATTKQDETVLRGRLLSAHPKVDPSDLICLCPLRREAEAVNMRELAKLDGATHLFKASITTYNAQGNPVVKHERDDSGFKYPVDVDLPLKVGARVLLCANLDLAAGLYNGAGGTVVEFRASRDRGGDKTLYPSVAFENGTTRLITTHSWDQKENRTVVSTFVQIPLILRAAMTCHKAQGLTLGKVLIKTSSLFAEGQGYVVLSRARRLDDIYLTDLDVRKFKASPEVLAYYRDNLLL